MGPQALKPSRRLLARNRGCTHWLMNHVRGSSSMNVTKSRNGSGHPALVACLPAGLASQPVVNGGGHLEPKTVPRTRLHER